MTWHEFVRRVRGSLRSERLDREMEAEMSFHMEMAAAKYEREGLSSAEARRRAMVRFGSAETFREEGRNALRLRGVETLFSDVRYAVRSFRRAPSFSLAATLTMALGIAACVGVFSVVNAVLLRPLPFAHPEQLAYIGWDWGTDGEIHALSAYQYEYLRAHAQTFAVATYAAPEAHVGSELDSAPVRGLQVTEDFFDVLQVQPEQGRAFDAAEQTPGGPNVVVLGYGTWQQQFGGQPMLGREIHIGGEPHTVVGVMARDFRFPQAAGHTGYIVPMRMRANPIDEGHNSTVIARVRADAPRERVDADLAALSASFRAEHPDLAEPEESFGLYTHADVFAGDVRHTLWVLFGAVGLLLVIACANTTTLLLVRASYRQREIAVRTSLGAGRARVLQQLLTEGIVLAVTASALGVALSFIAVRAFVALSPVALPADDIQADVRMIAFVVAVTLATAAVFAAAAALPTLRDRMNGAQLFNTRGALGGGNRMREALVVAQTAIAVLLLVGATLLGTSFGKLMRVDPGFDTRDVIAVRLGRMPPSLDGEQLATRIHTGLVAHPAVAAAAITSSLPLERGLNFPIDTPDRPDRGIGDVELRFVTPEYFATLGVQLKRGRTFAETDREGTEYVAIVNEAFARHYWSDASPIDRTIRIGHFKGRWINPRLERSTRVVGVAEDVKELGLQRDPKPTVFVPRAQLNDGPPLLLVRAAANASLNEIVRDIIAAEEPRLRPEIEPLRAIVGRSVATPRFRMLIIVSFAAAALLLAAIGIYGVVASVVAQRRREIGLRIALGATSRSVILSVVRRTAVIVVTGVLAGIAASFLAARVLEGMLYDMSPTEPLVLLTVGALLLLVATLAAWVPSRAATRVDPSLPLRGD
jgi:putative ABC transport system permease protein